jgi:hypothetical protein
MKYCLWVPFSSLLKKGITFLQRNTRFMSVREIECHVLEVEGQFSDII